MTEPAFRYVVLRAHPDLPRGFLPPEQEGRWYSLDILDSVPAGEEWSLGGAVAIPTDRFERRDSDGATARVYEVRS